MGSVPFAGEDESQPSTSNGKSCKLSRTLLDGCDGVNHASIPRKLRSVIKKRGRESITSPLLMSRKQRHVSTAVDTVKKDGAKKSKLKTKQGQHITKDEEEVAETLYALAGFFSDANKADQQEFDDEKPEIKSSATLEEGRSINAARDTCPMLQEETRKMSSKVTLKAVFPSSNLVNSTAKEINSQTLEAPQPEFFSSKQAVTPNAYGGQSELSPCSSSRPLVSILSMNKNGEQEIHLDQVTASGSQYGKNCSSIGEQYKDLLLSPNATRATSSETHKSCPSARIHSLFESTNFSSQPRAIENKITTEKETRAPESNMSWKRCSAHVYISRLIKVLQISDRKEELPVQPPQSTTCGGAERQPSVSIHNQMPRINGRNGDAYFSAIDLFSAKKDLSDIQNNILLDKRPIQDQQMASETSTLGSTKQGYDFLSLGTGLCGLDTGKSAKGAGSFREPPQQFHMPYLQSQNHSSMFCSLPQNGYSSSFHSHNSALAAQQVQLPQYHSSTVNFTGRTGQQMELQQQKWAAQLQAHYNMGGGGVPRMPEWKNGVDSASMLNYAHSLFPHLHDALGSKYQQLSPSQQQVMAINSNISRLHHNHLPLGFERNGTVFRSENMAQLQLPCNLPLGFERNGTVFRSENMAQLQLPCNQHL